MVGQEAIVRHIGLGRRSVPLAVLKEVELAGEVGGDEEGDRNTLRLDALLGESGPAGTP